LLWLTSLYVLPANAACVVNFGERQCGPFEVQPAVIIKSALAKPGLQQALGRPVQQLAQLEGAGLYLLASDDPIVEAQRLSAQAYVHYAQPDVSQKRMLHTDLPDASAWPTRFYIREMSTKGAGVRIAIIDDGFDLSHEDLQGVDVGFSYDADHKTLGASPVSGLDQHGTRVAGVIFAQHNGVGIDGIAPEATLIPIRQVGTRTSDTVLAFTVAALAGADIINCSWNSPVLMQPVADVIQHLARHGRDGRGVAIFFASGNEGIVLEPGSREAAIVDVIAVGSLHHDEIAPYSNRGDAVDLYLPGRLQTTTRNGYGMFQGTSASAALASGLAALLFAQRPAMGPEQLRAALANFGQGPFLARGSQR
jgi:subtilisin family serine protease